MKVANQGDEVSTGSGPLPTVMVESAQPRLSADVLNILLYPALQARRLGCPIVDLTVFN